MKSIKIYLFPLFFFVLFSTPIFSQNDFYSEDKKAEQREQKLSKTDSVITFEYYTEEDYHEAHNINTVQEDSDAEIYYEDESYSDEDDIYDDKENRKKNNSIAGEVVAEIIYNVFINVAFVVAAFWQ